MSGDPYTGPRLVLFGFLAVAVGLLALCALAVLAWALAAMR